MDKKNLLTYIKTQDLIKLAGKLGFTMTEPIWIGMDGICSLHNEDEEIPLLFQTTYEEKSTNEIFSILTIHASNTGIRVRILYELTAIKQIRLQVTWAFQALIERLVGGNDLIETDRSPDSGDYSYQWVNTSEGRNLR